MMITTTSKNISVEKLWERIAIRPPYFAIEGISLDPSGVLSAHVPVQHRMEQEDGPISAAEVGRHLAILGLCSIALQWKDPKKHYYLAQRAHLTRRGLVSELVNKASLLGLAWPIVINKRNATARTQLLAGNQTVLYDLTVRYAVVGARLFERMFSRYRLQDISLDAGDFNPYTRALPLKNVTISGRRLTALLQVESARQCIGHFPNYPAIPVAILMQALGRASARLIQEVHGFSDFSYMISDAEVRAENLAFAHEDVELVVDYLHGMDDIHVLSCTATTSSRQEVGQVELTVQQCSRNVRENVRRHFLSNAGVILS